MNYKKRMSFLFIILIILSAGYTYSQSFGVGLGVMRNNAPSEISNSLYSFYPQVSLSGGLIPESIGWEISFGLTFDMLERSDVGINHGYYNNTSYILSSKLLLDFAGYCGENYLPAVLTGFSLHYIHSEPVYPGESVPTTSPIFPELDNQRFFIDFGLEKKIYTVYEIGFSVRIVSSIPLDNKMYHYSIPSRVNNFLHNQVKHSLLLVIKL